MQIIPVLCLAAVIVAVGAYTRPLTQDEVQGILSTQVALASEADPPHVRQKRGLLLGGLAGAGLLGAGLLGAGIAGAGLAGAGIAGAGLAGAGLGLAAGFV